MEDRKKLNIALVAHDSRKKELLEWAEYNIMTLANHNLYATGTTGKLIQNMFDKHSNYFRSYRINDDNSIDDICEIPQVNKVLSGPLGGDSVIGAMIAMGEIDMLIFFCDNLITQGHQQDISALSRLASLYNIPFATNRTTADMIITSHLFADPNYERIIPGAIDKYVNRKLK